jgi:hypothetical protein
MTGIVIPDGGTIGSASDTDAISISSSGAVTLSSDFVPATPLSHRNMIINGAMQVAQRGTSFVSPSSGSYTLDRFSALNGTDGIYTITQDSSTPTASEAGVYFTKSLKLDVTTSDTSIDASQLCWIETKIEGQDVAIAGFGQSGTRYVTLSFWHKHTKTGIHSVVIKNGNQDRSYVAEYTQSTTDTWEKATITIPVDTSGTWAYDNTAGIRILFSIAVGSTYQATGGSWVAGNYHGSVNQVNNLDSTSNNFQITGVQLELGSVATPFENRSYGEELARCQRYFQVHQIAGAGVWNSTTRFLTAVHLPVEMRATPTMSSLSGVLTNINVEDDDTYNVSSISLYHPSSVAYMRSNLSQVIDVSSGTGRATGEGGLACMDQNNDGGTYTSEL